MLKVALTPQRVEEIKTELKEGSKNLVTLTEATNELTKLSGLLKEAITQKNITLIPQIVKRATILNTNLKALNPNVTTQEITNFQTRLNDLLKDTKSAVNIIKGNQPAPAVQSAPTPGK